MFGWWKKNEGFEWREYVRTTILVRRQKRRDRLVDAKQAAVDGLKDAGRAGAAGLKEAGKVGAAASASGLSRLGAALAAAGRKLGPLTVSGLTAIGRFPSHIGRMLRPMFLPLGRALTRSGMLWPMLLIGLVAAVAALARHLTHGFDTEARIAAAIGVAGICLGLLPSVLGLEGGPRSRWLDAATSRLPRIRVSPALGGGAILAALLGVAGVAGLRWLEPQARGSLLSNLPLVSKPIEGRATVLGPDIMKVGNIIVRLSGTEAPEAEQRCAAGAKKQSRCTEAAHEGLNRLVRGKLVSCSVSGSDESGRSLAACKAEGTDVAASMVRQGLLFAQQGMLSRYASAEIEARTSKSGMWKGDIQRPAEWRAKRWEEAKRSAPDGCPIKGAVSADGKFYLLPWSREYDRVKVRTGRGERWFCSEQEARAAGWRLSEKS